MAAAPNQLLGRAQIYLNGGFQDAKPGSSLKPGGYKNNPRLSSFKFNFNQSFIASEVKASFPVNSAVSITALQGLTGATITFNCDTGQQYTITNAAQTGELELKDGDDGGFIECTFNGDPAVEVLP